MDFYQICERKARKSQGDENSGILIYPNFIVDRSKDLMVRGKSFYAIWDEKKGLWSTDEYDVARLVDEELWAYCREQQETRVESFSVRTLKDFSSKAWTEFQSYLKNVPDSSIQLDEQLTFSDTVVKKEDYRSRRLPYPLLKGDCNGWEELIGTLYEPEERAKIEWAVGSIVAGDSKDIQKFLVLYGEAGSGKSTILNIIQQLFAGYYTTFEAKALTSGSNQFSTEVFKANPLVGIQHDGDLSRIEDNSKLNSIISHEEMQMNEKYKPGYTARADVFLFMATNRPVKITDAKSGIIRRLIDVKPSGKKILPSRYFELMKQIEFELGSIAYHCQEIYLSMGKNYYSDYRPFDMMMQTDVFFNFVEDSYDIFKEQDGTTLAQAYEMYKTYCTEGLVEYKMPKYRFREELKNYFRAFEAVSRIGEENKQARSCYFGFLGDKFVAPEIIPVSAAVSVPLLNNGHSTLEDTLSAYPAQYASTSGTPLKKWASVATTLADLDTSKLHYVKPPENHIVIDFDLKGEDGEKSLEKNLEAAALWPATYSEVSRSGRALHLHYVFEGDTKTLAGEYSPGIEIKTFMGNSSLRRQLTKCNQSPVVTISSGLPLKGEKVVNFEAIKTEKGLRRMIARNMAKEFHAGTKPSMDFIKKILDNAYSSGFKYDVTDMRQAILSFAAGSTNQADYCLKLMDDLKFKSDEPSASSEDYPVDKLVYFDVEVFPNLVLICWKMEGKNKVYLFNPTPAQVEPLLKFMLVGFNCRRYDNHIIYAIYIGYTIPQIYTLSQRLIANSPNSTFSQAYSLSYTDIYDFSSKKQSLKLWEIERGGHHKELGLPWDQPVPEEKWPLVAEYCGNDVDETEGTFHYLAADWRARLILAKLSGLTPNHSTQQHAAKIIFGDEPNPQQYFVYTDLSKEFPGYSYERGKSSYHPKWAAEPINPKEGGWVWAKVGAWGNVPLLDIDSMHPATIEALNVFGPYTRRYLDIRDAQLAIKYKRYEEAEKMLDGALVEFMYDEMGEISKDIMDLRYALKIVCNLVYGLTFASFPNIFKDPRNVDNMVAKRGALFMIELKHAVEEQGYNVVHIKTDSIKIADGSPEAIQFVKDFGKKYGYNFSLETTYDKFCLINDAVYLARHRTDKGLGEWEAKGAQFIQPYVFKKLCTGDDIEFADLFETKTVKTAMYLDMDENLPDGEHDYHFIGKAGAFCPMKPGAGGGRLMRIDKDGEKFHAVTGTKGYRWLEAETVQTLQKEGAIDEGYYRTLVEDAKSAIDKYADLTWFFSDDPYVYGDNGILPF